MSFICCSPSLQATCRLCTSSPTSQHPSGRWTSTAGFLCTGRRCSLRCPSWRRCCTVGKRSKLHFICFNTRWQHSENRHGSVNVMKTRQDRNHNHLISAELLQFTLKKHIRRVKSGLFLICEHNCVFIFDVFAVFFAQIDKMLQLRDSFRNFWMSSQYVEPPPGCEQMFSVDPNKPKVVLCVSASFSLTLEETTPEGETFLTLAVKAGLEENVKMLLDHGASPHTTNTKNESPLLLGQSVPAHHCSPVGRPSSVLTCVSSLQRSEPDLVRWSPV